MKISKHIGIIGSGFVGSAVRYGFSPNVGVDADALSPFPTAVGRVAGHPPHLVVPGEEPGDRVADLASQTGDEDPAIG